MTLYHYRTNFDMDGYRSCVNWEQDYTFGDSAWDAELGKSVYKPFIKIEIEIAKKTPKGYKDKFGNLYFEKDLDKIQIINCTGRRVNCIIDFFSFRDDVTLKEIKQQFTEKILSALQHE